MVSWILLLVCYTHIHTVKAEVFSSLQALQNLANNEEWLLSEIHKYLANDNVQAVSGGEVDEITRLANDCCGDGTHKDSEHEGGRVLDHPINAFNVIKRWHRLARLSTSENFSYIRTLATERELVLPEQQDYDGAITALVRLQRTYRLPTVDLAAGRVHNRLASRGLDLQDCLAMSRVLMTLDHGLAMTWVDLILLDPGTDAETESEALACKLAIFKQCGNISEALEVARTLAQADSKNRERIQEVNSLKTALQSQPSVGQQNLDIEPRDYWKDARVRGLEKYEALCRGDIQNNTLFVNKNLICIYRRGVLPYIAYKEEIHSFDPRISVFYDVITDTQADMLKKKAFPLLYRAKVGSPENRRVAESRVGQITWLYDTDPEVAGMSRKVADITGLATEYRERFSDADALQMSNYGLGGQCEPHHDFQQVESLQNVPSFVRDMGNRIATFMFYLSDVTAGGATVFPLLDVRISPVKNAAAFWYNFRPRDVDTGDLRTKHAGCPVLIGQKWAANKWIRQAGQLFRRPCGLTKDQTDPIWNI